MELHGTTAKHRCIKEGHSIENVTIDTICEMCGDDAYSFPRPDCVLFFENILDETWIKAQMAASSLGIGDVCIIVGHSANVYPASYLPEIAYERGATIIEINVSQTRFQKDYNENGQDERILFIQDGAKDGLVKLLDMDKIQSLFETTSN